MQITRHGFNWNTISKHAFNIKIENINLIVTNSIEYFNLYKFIFDWTIEFKWVKMHENINL